MFFYTFVKKKSSSLLSFPDALEKALAIRLAFSIMVKCVYGKTKRKAVFIYGSGTGEKREQDGGHAGQ